MGTAGGTALDMGKVGEAWVSLGLAEKGLLFACSDDSAMEFIFTFIKFKPNFRIYLFLIRMHEVLLLIHNWATFDSGSNELGTLYSKVSPAHSIPVYPYTHTSF
jgi:hypothetical protein